MMNMKVWKSELSKRKTRLKNMSNWNNTGHEIYESKKVVNEMRWLLNCFDNLYSVISKYGGVEIMPEYFQIESKNGMILNILLTPIQPSNDDYFRFNHNLNFSLNAFNLSLHYMDDYSKNTVKDARGGIIKRGSFNLDNLTNNLDYAISNFIERGVPTNEKVGEN